MGGLQSSAAAAAAVVVAVCERVVSGFVNTGNTCYAAVVLQDLQHCPTLLRGLLELPEAEDVPNGKVDGRDDVVAKHTLLYEMRGRFLEAWSFGVAGHVPPRCGWVAPSTDVVRSYLGGDYLSGRMMCSVECEDALLRRMHQDCCALGFGDPGTDGQFQTLEQALEHRPRSPALNPFSLTLRTKVCCGNPKCKHTTTRYRNELAYHVHLPGPKMRYQWQWMDLTGKWWAFKASEALERAFQHGKTSLRVDLSAAGTTPTVEVVLMPADARKRTHLQRRTVHHVRRVLAPCFDVEWVSLASCLALDVDDKVEFLCEKCGETSTGTSSESIVEDSLAAPPVLRFQLLRGELDDAKNETLVQFHYLLHDRLSLKAPPLDASILIYLTKSFVRNCASAEECAKPSQQKRPGVYPRAKRLK